MKSANFPKKLVEIRDFLSEEDVTLSSRFADGRVNARINEDKVIKAIQSQFDVQESRMRDWFDFSLTERDVFYPVNIKITDTTHADNLNCKLGVYYALTGRLPDFPNEVSWLDYFEKLKANLKENSKDYYFLVVNKTDMQDVFINSLKSLSILQPNGNNLPFQCKWNVNRTPNSRRFGEAKKLILGTFGESIKQRAEAYFIFKRLFNEYVR